MSEQKSQETKVEWIKNGIEGIKYELSYNKETKELEVCRYYYPLLGKGYGNYAAICISYGDNTLKYVDFSDGWGGSGVHIVEEKKGVKIDVDELAKDSPRRAFVYLVSFFMDERTIDILFNDDEEESDEELEEEEDDLPEDDEDYDEEDDDMDLEDLFVDNEEDDEE